MAGLASTTQVLGGGSTVERLTENMVDYLLGEVTQPSESRLNEPNSHSAAYIRRECS